MCSSTEIAYDDFIRTTEHRHMNAVSHLWRTLEERGHIYMGKHEGWYSPSDETFVPLAQTKVGIPLFPFPSAPFTSNRPLLSVLYNRPQLTNLKHIVFLLLSTTGSLPERTPPSRRARGRQLGDGSHFGRVRTSARVG